MPQDVSRHLTPEEAVVYARFTAAFPDRADVRPFRTDARNEVDSWHLAGEPSTWPVPAAVAPLEDLEDLEVPAPVAEPEPQPEPQPELVPHIRQPEPQDGTGE
jgi:hypothetical protein